MKNNDQKAVLKTLKEFAKPYKWQLIFASIASIILSSVNLLPALLSSKLIDRIMDPNLSNDDKFRYTLIIGLSLPAIILVAYGLLCIANFVLQKTGLKIVRDIREKVFRKIEAFSIRDLDRLPVGKFVTRVTNDTLLLSDLFRYVITSFCSQLLTIVVAEIILLVKAWQIGLYTLFMIPLTAVMAFVFKVKSRNTYMNVRNKISDINAFLSENFTGIKTIQLFNKEEEKFDEFKQYSDSLKKAYRKEMQVFAVFQPLIYVVYIVSTLAVILIGIYLYREGSMPVEVFVLAYQFVGSIFYPIQAIADLFNPIQQGFTSTERIIEILETTTEAQNSGSVIAANLQGKIEFRNVYFKYDKNGDWILKDISFIAYPKESVALVGKTGAGKTTILSLITRNYDIDAGDIFIDDVNIKDYDIDSLRRCVGQMMQNVFLFSGTIKDNITLFDNTITEERVVYATKYIDCDKIISKSPLGIYQQVLENGSNFSAGERQLLSFARTVAHEPNIMILDEATANIDTETEKKIQESLERMQTVGTMIIVAHRLSTIEHADKIIVLDKGEIKEIGNHDSLMKEQGYYYELQKNNQHIE